MPQSARGDAFWKKLREDNDRTQREADQNMKQMIEEQKKQLHDLMQKPWENRELQARSLL
jgi:hypothetical protein